MSDPFYRPSIYGRLSDLASMASHGSDITVAVGFPLDERSPWMIVRRPGAEYWLAFSDESILRGLRDE